MTGGKSPRKADDLADFLIPIRSGLTPTDEPTGLPPDIAAELDRQLRALDAARTAAWLSSRDYIVRGNAR